jgi:hypothetical protein
MLAGAPIPQAETTEPSAASEMDIKKKGKKGKKSRKGKKRKGKKKKSKKKKKKKKNKERLFPRG